VLLTCSAPYANEVGRDSRLFRCRLAPQAATFSDLAIDLAGDGYTLHATTGGSLPDIDSSAFNIT
jgi:hypothetical protein